MRNHTSVTEFIFLGISNTEGLENVLFVLFLAFYLFTLLGNLIIFLTILASSNLHNPMYFFLGNLSMFDIFFPSVISPKMMVFLVGQSRTISYQGCASQVFFYHTLGGTECFLYTVMAYDRFVAICHPMQYMIIMNHRVTLLWPQQGAQFFCDIPVVLPLACADTSLAQMVSFTNIGVIALMCFLLILTSYTRIALSILKIHSSAGRRRAFSTCSAHLTSILFFYGPVFLVYLRPASSPWLDSVVQVLNSIVTPSLNPLIYTLRNKDVKLALRKMLVQITHTSGA
ncbi:PREDICTED: olfactory receptor 149-like [Chinchilla lanigera]|uniref:olfactory receptor 149-like n=1 Tax=Chinchilla lanigera TaxID=34839 RepID=UPI00069779CF|nr:PREDICTED: olfactory receptor 149-like [Chinchilla lanigera]